MQCRQQIPQTQPGYNMQAGFSLHKIRFWHRAPHCSQECPQQDRQYIFLHDLFFFFGSFSSMKRTLGMECTCQVVSLNVWATPIKMYVQPHSAAALCSVMVCAVGLGRQPDLKAKSTGTVSGVVKKQQQHFRKQKKNNWLNVYNVLSFTHAYITHRKCCVYISCITFPTLVLASEKLGKVRFCGGLCLFVLVSTSDLGIKNFSSFLT